MTKYLITGGAGFIGGHLVDFLLQDGVKPQDIRLLVTSREKLKNLTNKEYDVVIGDIRNKKQVNEAVKGVSVIYHLATKTGVGDGSYEYLRDTNVTGTKNLVEAAVKNDVKKFIFFSSVGVYGFPSTFGDIRNVDESQKRTNTVGYGRTKHEAEDIVLEACAGSNMKYIIIRPTIVFGPGSKDSLTQLINAVKKGYFFFIGDGSKKMDYVYVKDVVRTARRLEKSKVVNEDFIVGPEDHLTQRQVVNIISEALGVKAPKIILPKNFAFFISYIIQYLSQSFGIKPVLFPDRVKVLSSDFYFNTRKLKKFGFIPKYSFKEGIAETVIGV